MCHSLPVTTSPPPSQARVFRGKMPAAIHSFPRGQAAEEVFGLQMVREAQLSPFPEKGLGGVHTIAVQTGSLRLLRPDR